MKIRLDVIRGLARKAGHTPFIEIGKGIYAKNEAKNPTGSIKDRVAFTILLRAVASHQLLKGDLVIDATSGSTGVALAYLTHELGLRFMAVIPSDISEANKEKMISYGATLVVVESGDMALAIERRNELVLKYNAFCTNQYESGLTIESHSIYTGAEILSDISSLGLRLSLKAFVACVGSGSTLMGISHKLHSYYPTMEVVAVEPAESAILTAKRNHKIDDFVHSAHAIQGVAHGFIPPAILNLDINHVLTVPSHYAIERTHKLNRDHNLNVSFSAGMNVLACEQYIEQYGLANDAFVCTVLPGMGNPSLSN